jgi:hypothetical protein
MAAQKYIYLWILMSSWISIHAQDTIFKKNHEIILSKILEVNEKNVKYKLFHEPEGP